MHDSVGNPFNNDRRNAFGWLVKQDDQRIAHQRARDGEHLLFAAAHVAAAPVAQFGEVGEEFKHGLHGPGRRRRAVRGFAWRPHADVEIFQDGQVGENAAVFRGKADAEPGNFERLERRDVRPLRRTLPFRRGNNPMTAFMVVDLPAPFLPISATTSPRPTVKLMSNRMCAAPYQALRLVDRECG